jgi:hypothetical protein
MSTSITSTSSLSDVLIAFNQRKVTTTDWTALTPPNYLDGVPAIVPVTSWTAKVGLFGDELTPFFENCATVGYTECNPAQFAAFSGWAVGMEITVATALATSE